MLLDCALETFSEAHWQRAFGAFVKANRSHWTGPPYDVVKGILAKKGVYEFGFPSMGTWTCRFRLAVRDDGRVEAAFVKNPDLPERMREKLDEMERVFEAAMHSPYP